MTVIAHITDVHLPWMPLPRFGEVSAKQALGLLNWYRARRATHTPKALELLLADLAEQQFDHMIVSGDLVNLALTEELEAGAAFLKKVEGFVRGGKAQRGAALSFTPGNHDYYAGPAPFEAGGAFTRFMTSDIIGASLGGGTGPQEPFVRLIKNEVVIVGINSAIPTPLFKAYGEVSTYQLAQMGKILKKAKAHGFYRCVVVHHPPLLKLAGKNREMLNAEAFARTLEEAGADLVLYGHNHRQGYNRLKTVDGPCHLVGAPSASGANAERYDLARYNLFDITREGSSWRTSLSGRGLDPRVSRIQRAEMRVL